MTPKVTHTHRVHLQKGSTSGKRSLNRPQPLSHWPTFLDRQPFTSFAWPWAELRSAGDFVTSVLIIQLRPAGQVASVRMARAAMEPDSPERQAGGKCSAGEGAGDCCPIWYLMNRKVTI